MWDYRNFSQYPNNYLWYGYSYLHPYQYCYYPNPYLYSCYYPHPRSSYKFKIRDSNFYRPTYEEYKVEILYYHDNGPDGNSGLEDTWVKDKFVRHRLRADRYWGTRVFSKQSLPEYIWDKDDLPDYLSADDFVSSDRKTWESPKALKLRKLFERMENRSRSQHIVNLYYMDIKYVGEPNVIGKCYCVNNGHIHIVLAKHPSTNVFAHELGHAFYFTNQNLNGKDPISGEDHNNDVQNLMYPSTPSGTMMKLEPQQRAAIKNSYIVNGTDMTGQYLSIPNKDISFFICEDGKVSCG
ncbi:hypothetical protein CON11_26685 [Priestia megaterium]|uniref:hypothetical protein n=1 Tax=Priestia megaterium TaxID=1404 RepID=UPI000BEE1AB7|nr:hypothetical protein [Priestia megaterium]PEC41742.1 hypothetical protein CON11_26685 [Priestia megaterium]